jgi:HEAT repeat protein
MDQTNAEKELGVPSPKSGMEWELSSEERDKAKIVCEFTMDLTKAILRSGYYDPDHPSSKTAKLGLYDAFINSLGDAKEIMLSYKESGENTDILIMGIIDEPINVRRILGTRIAELFVPKLKEYFQRKGLESFAVKKQITPSHFETFVDIMSDPGVDIVKDAKIGEFLTNALIQHGIAEVSTVFMDDAIALERNLPWRVAITIRRLAKDLKVLPMLRNITEEEMKSLKVNIIRDIIRPLRHPTFLKDLAVNCSVIARHVANVETEETEQAIINAFPAELLLPTSQLIFKEFKKVKDNLSVDSENESAARYCIEMKRILAIVAHRIVLEKVPEAGDLLETLYCNDIISFENLPEEIQYRVTTKQMAEDVRTNIEKYVNDAVSATSADDAAHHVKFFKRIIPELVKHEDWPILLEITKAVETTSTKSASFSSDPDLPSNPVDFIFIDSKKDLISAYKKPGAAQRQYIDEIVRRLDHLCIDILNKVLLECEIAGVRKAAVESLSQKGDMAKKWALTILNDSNQSWHIQGNALLVLGHAGNEKDVNIVKEFLKNPHPGLRIEALNALIKLQAKDAEVSILDALDGKDEEVRKNAVKALQLVSPLSRESITRLLEMIKAGWPKEKNRVPDHARYVARLIEILVTMKSPDDKEFIEDAILEVANKMLKEGKSIFKFLKSATDNDRSEIINSAMESLENIGGPKSVAFLKMVVKNKSKFSEIAQKVLSAIENSH